MPPHRYVQGWGALSLAVGAVLVGTAAQCSPGPDRPSDPAPDPTTVVSVDGCGAGGLCSALRHTVLRHTVVLGGDGPVLTGDPVTLDEPPLSGPVELALRTNLSWPAWLRGSALAASTTGTPSPGPAATVLRPAL
ncbi:hypothetical protein [Streptomyces sp. NPDC058664]|uniref:hypothetical protein n=1 Tax=unclassified Streptomyces TaxID=2593676 RepID=UPI00364CD95F